MHARFQQRLHRDVSIRAPELPPGRYLHPRRRHRPRAFQSAPRSYLRGDPTPSFHARSRNWFQSAPRSYLRGDLFITTFVTVLKAFQSAPRSYLRGDRNFRGTAWKTRRFQSAPRSYLRGDSGPANGLGRKVLLQAFREPRSLVDARLVSDVKEQS